MATKLGIANRVRILKEWLQAQARDRFTKSIDPVPMTQVKMRERDENGVIRVVIKEERIRE